MNMPDRNPFQHPRTAPAVARAAVTTPPQVLVRELRAQAVERIDKPWGFEEIVALVENRYAGKILSIDAGRSLSLQHHQSKDETLCVESGHVRLEYGHDADDLRSIDLLPGERVHITPGLLHRITAVADSRILETSTADAGWREDIVRHSDLYGRAGTTRP